MNAQPERPGPPHSNGSRRHVEQPTELVRLADGTLRFRVHCICGWQSDVVTADRTVELFEQHERS